MPIGCPLEFISSDALIFLSLYPSYERGVLWEEGGYSDQPNSYNEAMSVVANEIAAYEAKRAEEQAEAAQAPTTAELAALESPRLDAARK